MIHPVRLVVQSFRGWRGPAEFRLDRAVTAIVGENGCGKSSTLNAVEWCLFGSEVEKRGSGLPERQDWEVAPRGGAAGPTRVSLTLAVDGADVELIRERPSGARHDEFSITLADGCRLDATRADRWLRERGLDDWETYRRAHCFHQEAARRRVTEKSDRDAILATLLGLEADLRVREIIESQSSARVFSQLEDTLADLEGYILDRWTRPQRALGDVERRLGERGVSRAQIGPSRVAEIRERLIERARRLAAILELETQLPDASGVQALEEWARRWPSLARGDAPGLRRLAGLQTRKGKLAGALATAEPAEARWKGARRDLLEARRDGGERAHREAERDAAEQALRAAREALKQTQALAALLRDALEVLTPTPARLECPVCETPVPDLLGRIETALGRLDSDRVAALEAEITDHTARLERARAALADLEGLADAEAAASSHLEKARVALTQHLEDPAPGADYDAVAAARARIEALEAEIRGLEGLMAAREQSLAAHAADLELLRLFEEWDELSTRVTEELDLHRTPAGSELERAIDAAAGFALDLDALAGMAREVQEARSRAREAEVNQSLGEYYALITGTGGRLQVRTHMTAKRIGYQLVDATGAPALAVLNQAAINAVSLAMVCAQAEARARAGGLAWVVLDDPVQSLDVAHQAGLARALERLSDSCSVLLAVVPSALVDRLRDYVSAPRRIGYLGAWDPDGGASVERWEDR